MRGLVFMFGLLSSVVLADVSAAKVADQDGLKLLETSKHAVPDASQQTRVKENQKDQAAIFQLVMPPKLNLGLCDGSD